MDTDAIRAIMQVEDKGRLSQIFRGSVMQFLEGEGMIVRCDGMEDGLIELTPRGEVYCAAIKKLGLPVGKATYTWEMPDD